MHIFKIEKRRYFNNLDVTQIFDDEIISADRQMAEILNNNFVTVTENQGIADNLNNLQLTEGKSDPVDIAVEKYVNHPSIKAIQSRFQSGSLQT